jgi:DNA-directed RNA polymerase specialized sigma24 family protein
MESLDQIWRDYHSGLLSFIRRRVGAADLAEDILQDVFVKAHSRLDTLANADRIQSWLYQSVQRHCPDLPPVSRRYCLLSSLQQRRK